MMQVTRLKRFFPHGFIDMVGKRVERVTGNGMKESGWKLMLAVIERVTETAVWPGKRARNGSRFGAQMFPAAI